MAHTEESRGHPGEDETEEITAVFAEAEGDFAGGGGVGDPAPLAYAAPSAEPSAASAPTHSRKMLVAALVLGIVGTALAVIALVVGAIGLSAARNSQLRGPAGFLGGPGTYGQYQRGGPEWNDTERHGREWYGREWGDTEWDDTDLSEWDQSDSEQEFSYRRHRRGVGVERGGRGSMGHRGHRGHSEWVEVEVEEEVTLQD